MNKYLIGVLAAVILLVGGYFLLVNKASAPTKEQPILTETDTEEKQVIKEITVSGDDYSFSPAALNLKAGENVRLNFKNEGKVVHNWVIENGGVSSQTISPGETDTVDFAAPKSGKYTVYCSVPGHKERGMVGELTVE